MSTLFLVGTPIGNLEDISPRALDTLRGVSLIAAEDTRTAKQLLNHFVIHTPVTSYFEHSPAGKLNQLLGVLDTGDVAVVSEAGMPGINDPGFELVREAIARGHRISPIPGPSAVLAALVGSGIAAHSFYYVGFLPREPQARRKLLRELVKERDTIVAFETPRRLGSALEDLERIFGGTRQICAARELTKKFEEFKRGTVAAVRAYFMENEPRGEFTLVIEGATEDEGRGVRLRTRTKEGRARTTDEDPMEEEWTEARVKQEFGRLAGAGVPRAEAAKRIARESGWDRRRVYQVSLGSSRQT